MDHPINVDRISLLMHEEILDELYRRAILPTGNVEKDRELLYNEIRPINLAGLPYDVQSRVALFLSYDRIISLCKTSKVFSDICRDTNFWKKKLKKDFKVGKNLKGKEYKAMYQYLLGQSLLDEYKEIRQQIRSLDYIAEYDSEFEELEEKEKQAKTLYGKAKNLILLSRRILPIEWEYKYYELVGQRLNFRDLDHFIEILSRDDQELPEFYPGNVVGLRSSHGLDLYYIDQKDTGIEPKLKLIIRELPRAFNRYNTVEEIYQDYDFPFTVAKSADGYVLL